MNENTFHSNLCILDAAYILLVCIEKLIRPGNALTVPGCFFPISNHNTHATWWWHLPSRICLKRCFFAAAGMLLTPRSFWLLMCLGAQSVIGPWCSEMCEHQVVCRISGFLRILLFLVWFPLKKTMCFLFSIKLLKSFLLHLKRKPESQNMHSIRDLCSESCNASPFTYMVIKGLYMKLYHCQQNQQGFLAVFFFLEISVPNSPHQHRLRRRWLSI